MLKPIVRMVAAPAAALAVLAVPASLAAHHSLARFDTTTPMWVKGTVIRFDRIAPHALIQIEQKDGGKRQRWSVDGPAPNALNRMGIGEDFLKAGDVVEVCGFPLKADDEAQSAAARSANPNLSFGRAFSGHLLVMPNGKRRFWSDYGVLQKCLLPGETVQQLRDEATLVR